jgi:surface polysaccharide O-acyltransferase-like enzyme
MLKASLPLRNLRGVVILLLLAIHSFVAYVVAQPAHQLPFDLAANEWEWRAFPINDVERWLGFDLFSAFLFPFVMQLMFFISGFFVWQSLRRRGCRTFLGHRLLRLGVPFILGTYLLIPVGFYAVYRITAVDPSWSAFWSHWTALPITPSGPMWFLWFLFALNIGAAVLYRLSPRIGRFPAAMLAKTADPAHIGRLFIFIICISAAAYLPLSEFYPPWKWVEFGPFEFPPSFAPQYVIYFLLGLTLGANDNERSLLDPDGILVRHWVIWVIGSLTSFLFWIIPTAIVMKVPGASVAGLQLVGNLGLVIFVGAACFGMTAVFLRFGNVRWPIIDSISEHAFGIYFFHYAIVLWLQYALLDLRFPAVGKGLIVFIIAAVLSWGVAAATDWILENARLVLARGAILLKRPRSKNEFGRPR